MSSEVKELIMHSYLLKLFKVVYVYKQQLMIEINYPQFLFETNEADDVCDCVHQKLNITLLR